MKTKVSIIIPVYNVEEFLPACLDSVLSQTLREIEIICIDDASPDGCGQILDEYAKKDERLFVIHLPENHRQGYGRNLGLKKSSGEYVYFLDSDDMILKEAMEELYYTASHNQLDTIFFDAQTIFNSDQLATDFSDKVDTRAGVYPEETVSGRELFDAFVEQSEWQVFVQRQFWRRGFLLEEEIGFPENAEHEDQFFSFAGILSAKRARYIRKPYFVRRCRENSVMTSPLAPKNFHGYFVNIHQMIRFIRKHDICGNTIDKVILDLMNYMLSMRDVFLKTEHPVNWFQTHGLEDEYLFFDYLMKIRTEEDESRYQYDEKKFQPLESYEKIALYGAGKVAESLFRRLSRLGYFIENVIVTDKTGNPERFHRRPVISLQEFDPEEKTVVVVAMAKEHHNQISDQLKERNIEHFLYARDVLEGPVS